MEIGGGGCGRLGGRGLVGAYFTKKSHYTKFVKISKFCSKKLRGVNFTKEFPLGEISENPKILPKNHVENPILLYTNFKKSRSP